MKYTSPGGGGGGVRLHIDASMCSMRSWWHFSRGVGIGNWGYASQPHPPLLGTQIQNRLLLQYRKGKMKGKEKICTVKISSEYHMKRTKSLMAVQEMEYCIQN